jgi:hypothetical protein
MTPLTPKQVANLQHHPDAMVRRLVLTAMNALKRCEELTEENRTLSLEKPPILILADHKGCIEVKAERYQPVKVVSVNESNDRNPDTADDEARGKTPLAFRHLWDCKTIARGNVGVDRYKRSWIEAQVFLVKALTQRSDP